MRKTKLRSFILFGLLAATTITCASYKYFDNRIKEINKSFEEVVYAQTNAWFDEINKIDFSNENNKSNIKEINFQKNTFNLTEETYFNVDQINYCENEIKYVYDKLDDNVKEAIKDNLDEIPELEFIYSIGNNEEFSFESFIDENTDVSEAIREINSAKYVENEQINEKEKRPQKIGALTIGISAYLLGSLIACAGTIASSVWIPFVGWAIATIAFFALVTLIIKNYAQIRRSLNELSAYLCERFSNVSSLLSGLCANTYTQAGTEFANNVYLYAVSIGLSTNVPKEKIKDGLDKLLKYGTGAGLTGLAAFLGSTRPFVCLGPWSKTNCEYYEYAFKNGGVCFYTNIDVWGEILNSLGGDGWILNEAFLKIMIIEYDCYFYLFGTPGNYYTQMNNKRLQDRGYTDELQFIHTGTNEKMNTRNVTFSRYNWNEIKNMEIADHY